MAKGVENLKANFTLAKETKVIIQAKDEEFRRESQMIPGFMELGFATVNENNKHFRRVVSGQLEGSEFMGEDQFFTLDICRGKKVNFERKNLFQRIFSTKEEQFRNVGRFKGNVEVMSDELLNRLSLLNVPAHVMEQYQVPYNLEKFKYSQTDKEILKGVKVLIRVYVIDAMFNISKDLHSENDSYISLEMDGHAPQKSKKVLNNNSPKFFSTFQIEHILPGASDIKLRFFDSDPLKEDEFIGETSIDIERRFFDEQWRSFDEHPIETRAIFHPSSSIDVGVCRVFVEAFDMNSLIPPVRFINPRPKKTLELRVVVYTVWDVQSNDFEDVSDLYVKASLPNFDVSMSTDTHYRAQSGFGSFNWRMKFKIEVDEYFDERKADLVLMVYDKDLLSANDFIASSTINLSNLIKETLYYNKQRRYVGLDMDGKESTKFSQKMDLRATDKEDEKIPSIMLSIDCVTAQEAENSPVGIGRGDPNQNPYLEAPIGRFKFTLNPYGMLSQLVGPQFKKKVGAMLCILFLLVSLFLTIPIFFSEVFANFFERLIGVK